ncbi:MAG: kynureninase [Pseudomonadota bacterium]
MTPAPDPFARTRDLFDLPQGVIYLDGNSLGPLPRTVAARLNAAVQDEWGAMLIRGWIEAGWIDLPARVGDRIAALIGAAPGTVRCADSTSVDLFKVLSAALELRPDRRVILSDLGNFPTDLYVAGNLARALGRGHEVKAPPPEQVADHIDETVAVLMLTEVDYKTGRRHDMAALTAKAHAAGALVIWDLAHSAGAFPVDLTGADADFAVGCGYKYLNGGPGAPAFLYAAPRWHDALSPALSGWFGHAEPFAFDPAWRPAAGIDRLMTGTWPVLSMTALDEALKVWDGVDLAQVRARSEALTSRFIERVEAACGDALTLVTPRDPAARGSQVSFRHASGYAVMQALIARGVIGDFRAPDLLRFGFAPLYVTLEEVDRAAGILSEFLATGAWDAPEFHRRARVT